MPDSTGVAERILVFNFAIEINPEDLEHCFGKDENKIFSKMGSVELRGNTYEGFKLNAGLSSASSIF